MGICKGYDFECKFLAHFLTLLLSKADILIDRDGRARIANFWFLTVSDSTHTTASGSSEAAGMIRWMSPERLVPNQFGFEGGRATKESDCYALGMVIYEVLTGQVPFSSCDDFTVMEKVIGGERPKKPQGPEAMWFTDDLWGMLEQCWSPQPEARPTAEAILEHLKRGSTAWKPLPPTAGGFQMASGGGFQPDDDNTHLNDDDIYPSDDDLHPSDDDLPSDNYDDFQADYGGDTYDI